MKKPSAFAISAWTAMKRRNLSTSRYEAISFRNCSSPPRWTRRTNSIRRLGLVRRRLGQRPVRPAVFLPVVAEEVEAAEPLRPQEQALVGVEAVLQERPVHGLDERVQAEVRLLVFAGDGERHLGQGRARRGHARLAEEGEGERLARLRRVERTALELHARAARGNPRDRRGPDRPANERFRPPADAM